MSYKKLYDAETLFHYLLECRKGVRWKHSVQAYSLYAVANIARLAKMMRSEEWAFAPCRHFTIRERGKERDTEAASMDERVVQKALRSEILSPMLSRQLIYDCGATICNKGVSFARRRTVEHLRDYYLRFGNHGYVLQIDIKSYFASIDHRILLAKLRPLIKDERTKRLISYFVARNKRGLNLGSEINQSFATWFLAKVDHWCKEIFKLRHYARYMDDIYIIHPSKLYLTECLEKIKFMLTTLNLQANKQKTRIIPLERGFTFLKVHYTLSGSGKIKKRYGRESGKRIRRKLRKFTEKRVSPVTVRNEYQSWRKAMKKFDADGVIKACDAVYRKYTFGGRDGMD